MLAAFTEKSMIQLEAIASLAAQGFIVTVFPDGGFEVKGPEDKRSPAAKRQASYRQRMASQSITEHNKTSQTVTSDAHVTKPLPLSPSLPLSPQTPLSPAHPHTPAPVRTREAEALELDDSAKPAKSQGKGTQQELEAYAVEIGLPASDGIAMFDHWTANGWKNGQVASKCWKAGMRNWQRNNWMPSQKGGKMGGFNGHPKAKHAAYDAATATLGLTAKQIGEF